MNLASIYLDTGRTNEAIARFTRVLADCERVLGADHPYTLITAVILRRHTQKQGRPMRQSTSIGVPSLTLSAPSVPTTLTL